jgi:hypothetical protein
MLVDLTKSTSIKIRHKNKDSKERTCTADETVAGKGNST